MILKDIEGSDLISARYLSEHDEALNSFLDSLPSMAVDALVVLHLSGVSLPSISNGLELILQLHGTIFNFTWDDNQWRTLLLFGNQLARTRTPENRPGTDFFLNPQRSGHHTVDNRMDNSVTERCFLFILNDGGLANFPGIHLWAIKSKNRPWLWKTRKAKKALVNHQFKLQKFSLKFLQQNMRQNNKILPFWTLSLALQYLPYLLNKTTKSGKLISMAKFWSYKHILSLFPQDTDKAAEAVECYLARFDRRE
jgi:hypothetical protein